MISKVSGDSKKKDSNQFICKIYRETQILVILSNKAFQGYLWPVIQFYGGIFLIGLLYLLILFISLLGTFGVSVIVMTIFATGAICCSMLGLGRQTIILSNKFLRHAKSLSGCAEQRKFFQSCPTIALRVGEFHKMDSERIPFFIRFILQRTFFFVLKTKLSYNGELDMDTRF